MRFKLALVVGIAVIGVAAFGLPAWSHHSHGNYTQETMDLEGISSHTTGNPRTRSGSLSITTSVIKLAAPSQSSRPERSSTVTMTASRP